MPKKITKHRPRLYDAHGRTISEPKAREVYGPRGELIRKTISPTAEQAERALRKFHRQEGLPAHGFASAAKEHLNALRRRKIVEK